MQKRVFIEKLLALGETGPLSLLTMNQDGQPYLKLDRASHLIGMVGLNELVKIQHGQEMHESKEAFMLGLKIISHIKLLADRLSTKHKIHFVLEQTPAESTSYRFAKLDLKDFGRQAELAVKGDLSIGEVYYTNSSYFNVQAPINPVERVRQEGLFHPLIEAGALTHIWLGEAKPFKESIANFVIKTFQKTLNDQIAFSPEFTTCNNCSRTSRGLKDSCPYCGSTNVDGITRITGYFTKISSWNKGKRGELKDRFRNEIYLQKEGIINE
jgi:ribonucleoside-triphosphate reductase